MNLMILEKLETTNKGLPTFFTFIVLHTRMNSVVFSKLGATKKGLSHIPYTDKFSHQYEVADVDQVVNAV